MTDAANSTENAEAEPQSSEPKDTKKPSQDESQAGKGTDSQQDPKVKADAKAKTSEQKEKPGKGKDKSSKGKDKSSGKDKGKSKGKGKGKQRDLEDLKSKLPPDMKTFDMSDLKDLDMESLKAKLDEMQLGKGKTPLCVHGPDTSSLRVCSNSAYCHRSFLVQMWPMNLHCPQS